MNESDKERQENELLALESIYGERQFVVSPEKNGGKFAAYIELPENFKIAYPSVKAVDKKRSQLIPSDEEPAFEEISIHYLPPILLNFTLPVNYPSQLPPCYTLTCMWLNVLQISKLCDKLDDIWKELGCGSEVLYEWVQFLTDDVIIFLDISSPLLITRISQKLLRSHSSDQVGYDRRASQDASSIESIVNYLSAYDSQESTQRFNTSYFNCGVCFCEKLGSDCITFQPCKHIFCTECVSNYFVVQINDGSVRALNCPEDKCESQADPSMVKTLMSTELYEKYDKFLLQSTLDCMADMTYCPRTTCQARVLCDSDNQDMGRCGSCNFVFCVLCKRTYHGVAHCAVNSKELRSLRNEYVNGSPETRALMEKKYGPRRIKNLTEDYFSEAWIENFSKKCPCCKSSIEKIDGCNKMVCINCGTKFCWICHQEVSALDPYSHFNDLSSKCFNKLFEGVDLSDESDDDFEFF